jgi:hypothetical protein
MVGGEAGALGLRGWKLHYDIEYSFGDIISEDRS